MISVGGIRAHTLIGGSGPPLLVLHGAGGPNGWRRWHAALAERFTLYVPSHPGFGLSDAADWMRAGAAVPRNYSGSRAFAASDAPSRSAPSWGGWTPPGRPTRNPP